MALEDRTAFEGFRYAGRIEIRRDAGGGWYAVAIARNGKMIWRTSESYKRRAGVMGAIDWFSRALLGARRIERVPGSATRMGLVQYVTSEKGDA